MRYSLLFLLVFYCVASMAQNNWLRQPALSADGEQLAFSWQGDIWTVNTEGGRAHRLTVHQSYDSDPVWWPDGESVVFTSNRFENEDLFRFVIGEDRVDQLTYHSTDDVQASIDSEGTVWFSSERSYAQVEWDDEIMRLDTDQATPYRALDALGREPVASPSGNWLAIVRGACRVSREAYTGPANRDIWLYDREREKYREVIGWESQDIQPSWSAGDVLYFLSARTGTYNLYRVPIQKDGSFTGEPEQLTSYDEEGIRDYSVSLDGSTVIIERKTSFYRLDPETGSSSKVSIDVSGDYHFYPEEKKTYTADADEMAPSPNEQYLALVIRGDLFITQNEKEERQTKQLTDHPWRDHRVDWLNDSTLIFISDRTGSEELYLVRSADSEVSDLYQTLKYEVVRLTDNESIEQSFTLSNDRTKIAIERDRGTLIVADIDKGGELSGERTLLDGWASPRGLTWSPDDQWLAYSKSDLYFNREVYIHNLEGEAQPVNVSMHPRGDSDPFWSRDGTKIGFLSNRNNGDDDVWFAWLTEEDWLRSKEDWEEIADEKEEKSDTSELEDIDIDPGNIHERLEQVTRMPGDERNLLISKTGQTFYFTSAAGADDPALYSVKWDGSELKKIVDKAEYRRMMLDAKGTAAFVMQRNGQPGILNLKKAEFENRPFKARKLIDHRAEREQVFEEAWRALDLGFYDPDFHGRDWKALKEKYKDRCLLGSTAQDFRDMFNEMLGQLNASHMGIYGGNPEELQEERTGLLGIEGRPTEDGKGLQVLRVIPQTPADRPQSKLVAGDVISAVNGQSLERTINFYSLVSGTVDEKIYLNVRSPNGEDREVIIRPTGSVGGEMYEEWVSKRESLTEKYSNDRLGYIHIRGMNWSSFERFERELMASGHGKEGIVIDVRFNGGGWTTDMLMTVLSVRQHSYTIPRGAVEDLSEQHKAFRKYYPFGERLPLSAWTKPSIALCNQNSYSNAEIFSHAYKTLNIGTLIGQPTFGAVISTGGHGLMDGSFVRMPFRAWYVKATDKNMEHGPAVPDVLVNQPPAVKAKEEDPQLRAAVNTLLKEIDERDK